MNADQLIHIYNEQDEFNVNMWMSLRINSPRFWMFMSNHYQGIESRFTENVSMEKMMEHLFLYIEQSQRYVPGDSQYEDLLKFQEDYVIRQIYIIQTVEINLGFYTTEFRIRLSCEKRDEERERIEHLIMNL